MRKCLLFSDKGGHITLIQQDPFVSKKCKR